MINDDRIVDCVVDDVAAIIARLPLTLRARHYTSEKVANEVKDAESRESLEFMVETGFLAIINDKKIKLKLSKSLLRKLSEADKSLLRISIMLREKCKSIAVATDDYSLQEAAIELGFRVIPVRYRGAKSVRKT